jgi:hypothetical protein
MRRREISRFSAAWPLAAHAQQPAMLEVVMVLPTWRKVIVPP